MGGTYDSRRCLIQQSYKFAEELRFLDDNLFVFRHCHVHRRIYVVDIFSPVNL